jgi:hypothetical protein
MPPVSTVAIAGAGGVPAAAAEEEAEDGFTERIQAMIFHRSSSL